MGKSGEGRGLFRRRSTPVEQDPTIDITSVLAGYGRAATLAPAAAPISVVDDDTVRYTGAVEPEPVAELPDAAHEGLVVDLTEEAAPVAVETQETEEPVLLAGGQGTDEPEAVVEAVEQVADAEPTRAEPEAVEAVEQVADAEPTWAEPEAVEAVEQVAAQPEHVEHAEPLYASVSQEIPPPAGWWEDTSSGWGPADLDQIDAVVHGSLPTEEADQAPEPLSPDEAYGHHDEGAWQAAHAERAEPETIAWAVAGGEVVEHAGTDEAVAEPAVDAAAPVAWWQSLQTDDLGGLPVAGPEQHDEQHAHHHEVEPVAIEDRLAPIDESVPDQRPWWASLQDPAHDVPHEDDVVDLRDEQLSEDPEAVATRLARLRDAGLLSDEEYAAETASLLADRG